MAREPSDPSPAASAVLDKPTINPASADRSFYGHPRGLATLFFTEMWERFSYYGMRALLILFMTAAVSEGGLGFDTAKAGAIYGLYTAFVYLLALPGGWVADRVIGTRRAVLVGGVIIAAGHFSLAVPGMTTFYLGLGLIVIGTGLLKPNISAMVGDLYPEGGARRDAGFSIFYMGINVGAFAAPLIVGFLGETVNWHLGFAAAGVGMLLGLVQYVVGARHLGTAGVYIGDQQSQSRGMRQLSIAVLAAIVLLGGLFVMSTTGAVDLTPTGLADAAGVLISGIAIAYFLFVFFAGGLDPTERKRIGVVFILFLFSAVFWSGFEQAGSSLNLVAERLTDRVVFGWEAPASWLQAVNPLFIISLAPVFAWLWVALGSREPSSPLKFALGLILLGGGFLVMVVATSLAVTGREISPMWLVLTYFLHTSGELCLSPVGLSTVTKLAPQRYVGQMMGIWFMSISLGNLMAGRVAGMFETLPLPQLFGAVTATTAGAGIILLLLVRPIRKLMVGVH
jgi:proton-dependent oligopeptide transporter, POT family